MKLLQFFPFVQKMSDGQKQSAACCVRALTAFAEKGKTLLELANRESSEVSVQEFIRRRVGIEQEQSLLGLIEAAAALYTSLSVKRRKDAEDLWRQNYECAALRDAVHDFQQLAVQWDSFLQRLDDELNFSVETETRDHRSKRISPDTSLIDAKTGETVTLEEYLGIGRKTLLVLIRQFSCLLCRLHLRDLEKNQRCLDARSVRVVVVSFGCQEGASHWLKETGCQYDLLLDPERKIYTAFGLETSVKKVLNFSNMLLYAEYLADNMEFPRGLPSIQDDMFQLGGDFVLDEDGKVLFCHRCQSPIDRPSAEDILSTL